MNNFSSLTKSNLVLDFLQVSLNWTLFNSMPHI